MSCIATLQLECVSQRDSFHIIWTQITESTERESTVCIQIDVVLVVNAAVSVVLREYTAMDIFGFKNVETARNHSILYHLF